jgi:hypothetical protein
MLLKAAAFALSAWIVTAPASADPAASMPADQDKSSTRSFSERLHEILTKEALSAGVPDWLLEAVIHVESGFNPDARGSVGEIGLMQVRPGTAALLGFRGTPTELAQPDINVHFGATYLGRAWRVADGNLCRTLMKYRAGLGEEIFTQRSIDYCNRARLYLTAREWPANIPLPATHMAPTSRASAHSTPRPNSAALAYTKFKHGTEAASRVFWQLEKKRISALRAQVHAKWRRLAAR